MKQIIPLLFYYCTYCEYYYYFYYVKQICAHLHTIIIFFFVFFFCFFFLRKGEMLYAPSRGLRAPLVCGTAAYAALPTKTPSLSLGHGIPPRNRRQALLQGGGHLLASSASTSGFFSAISWSYPVCPAFSYAGHPGRSQRPSSNFSRPGA